VPRTKTTTRPSHADLRPAAAIVVALSLLLALCVFPRPAAASTPRRGTAGSSGTAGPSGPPPASSAQPPNSLPGLDVSHWQGTIDWAQVAASGKRFVIAKATEGRTSNDPMYATNRAGATAAGLAFTAYHFARPDASSGDAVAEADHFVDVAQLGPGTLRPVLDIERTGGLGPAALTTWALAWLDEVTARLGVRPMVYTSPNGWKVRFGDTTAIADAGYSVLWVAHWKVASPTVPADDWSGYGWRFWQYTDCGSVPGIAGCVDLDWYDGTDLGLDTIRGLTVSVSSPVGEVTSSPPGIACTAVCSANFEPGATVTLTAVPATGAVFLGWGGACTGTGPCTVTMNADVAVTATFATDVIPPTVTLASPTDLAGPLTATFGEIVRGVTPSNLALRVEGSGRDLPAVLVCRSPRGTAVVCFTGNVLTAEIQPSAPLVPGQSYTAIVDPPGVAPIVDRAGNPAPPTSQAFMAPTVVGQQSPAVQYRWRTVWNRSAFGGSYVVEHLGGASVSFTFGGKRITWYTVTGPAEGRATVSIDGRPRGTFDQFADTFSFRVARSFKLLKAGTHTITISVLGRKGPGRGPDRQVAVDAFRTGTRLYSSPPLDVAWRTARSAEASDRTFAESDLPGSSLSLTFRGTGLDWYTVLGPDQGRANLFVDGKLLKTVDAYAKETRYQARRPITGLADGVHTVRIVVLGESKPAATGTLVSLDGFVVRTAS